MGVKEINSNILEEWEENHQNNVSELQDNERPLERTAPKDETKFY